MNTEFNPRLFLASLRKADLASGLDVLARALFWEGFNDFPPYTGIRGRTSVAELCKFIERQMFEEFGPELFDSPAAIWFSPGSTGMYRKVLFAANAMANRVNKGLAAAGGEVSVDGEEVLARNMAVHRGDESLSGNRGPAAKGSVFWAAGNSFRKLGEEHVLSGKLTPERAAIVAATYIGHHVAALYNPMKRRIENEVENRESILEESSGGIPTEAREWATVIDSLLDDAASGDGAAVAGWMRGIVEERVPQPTRRSNLQRYLDLRLSDPNLQDGQIAKAMGLDAATITVTKRQLAEVFAEVLSDPGSIPSSIRRRMNLDFLESTAEPFLGRRVREDDSFRAASARRVATAFLAGRR